MNNNTKEEEMYNRIKDEYASVSKKILKTIKKIKSDRRDDKRKDRGENK